MARHRQQPTVTAGATQGILSARPRPPEQRRDSGQVSVGVQSLGIHAERDTLLYVPTGYQADRPAPLALMFHGAGGDAQGGLSPLQSLADATGLLLIAPASRVASWDVLYGGYGPDIELIDRALTLVFSRYAVDQEHIAVGGFSDGASYALSVGITNGALFSHVLAFSPGFMAPADQQDTPRFYISHGTRDTVLPIDRCSRRIVPQLQRAGYDVLYREFDGPHTVPAEIVQEAVDWFIQE